MVQDLADGRLLVPGPSALNGERGDGVGASWADVDHQAHQQLQRKTWGGG